MDFRRLIGELAAAGELTVIERPVECHLEMARVIRAMGDRAVLFKNVRDSGRASAMQVAANVCARRDYMARALGVPAERLLFVLAKALENPSKPPIVANAPCQEVIEPAVHLDRLPILTHAVRDGGPYVTSGALIARDPDYGVNMAIHRLMQLDAKSFAARLVENRGTHTAWKKAEGDVPVAICIGLPLHSSVGRGHVSRKGRE